jgi:ABC-type multidrug transport system ATPase subunit
VQTTLNKITSNLTTLFVTHKLDHVTNVDQIIYLADSKIVERGTYHELMQMQGEFADQVKSQNISYVAEDEESKSAEPVPAADADAVAADDATVAADDASNSDEERITIHIQE